MSNQEDAAAKSSPLAHRHIQDNAFSSLVECLRDLALIIKTSDDEPTREADHIKRKKYLRAYRNWVNDFHRFRGEELNESEYLDRLFPYIHNEFHFNAARKLGRMARVSHVVFAPLYIERTERDEIALSGWQRVLAWFRRPASTGFVSRAAAPPDELKHLTHGAKLTLDWLLKHAVHNSKEKESDFRGGKDYFFTFITELFDYSEPILTPKRLILEEKAKVIAKTACDQAKKDTATLDHQVKELGVSHRSTNVVEFYSKASGLEKVHCRWVRHDRPYQTFTITQENVITTDSQKCLPKRTLFSSEPWLEYFRHPDYTTAEDPFGATALDALEHDIFRPVVGRYVQGANYLVLPLKLFLRRKLEENEGSLAEGLSRILPERKEVFEKAAKWLDDPVVYDGLKDVAFERALQQIRETEKNRKTDEFDRLVASVTRNFLKLCFQGEKGLEVGYVAFKCMGGRAFVFSDARNNTREGGRVAYRELFSRTIIIDCGMNGFERGRLVQNLTEFETERVVALLNLPRFRLVHHALNAIQSRLSLANANYHDDRAQSEEVIPPHYSKARNIPEKVLKGERGLIVALEWLSSCLTVLNDVVEGGVSGRARIMSGSVQIIYGKLESIGHEPLLGHQSLKDFIERRFIRSTRTIERTGERYQMLRQRITENAELVDARLQVLQRDKEAWLLLAAEIFVAIGGAYYLGNLLFGIFYSRAEAGRGWLAMLFAYVHDVLFVYFPRFFGIVNESDSHLGAYLLSVILAVLVTLWFHIRRRKVDRDGPS